MTKAFPVMPGVPAAGHIAGGYWHPGSPEVCHKGACAPPPRRGIFGELCYTRGCRSRARWIAVAEARLPDATSRYRCEACCERIDAAAREEGTTR